MSNNQQYPYGQNHPHEPNRNYAVGGDPNLLGDWQRQGNQPPPQPPAPKKRHTVRNILLGITAGCVLLVGGCTAIVASMGGGNDPATQSAGPNSSTKPTVATPTNKPTAAKSTAAPKPTTKTGPKLTAGQEQAIGSAQSYLAYQAFSRKGLIKQLSSDYGEGFSVKDATFAVDYLKVNWNEQAAKKAKEYLQMQHFSRKGLIHQLESSYGEQFSHAQAVYGVNKAGL
ncbi:Ltp family lipoprotein [Kribbella karoonensis]|uniref:Ltp family lipoprotein n=1 Tax=Kribbella karoonensis TaxID=324851 RepID=A0ABN2E3C4_9ACTN